ncbi:metal-dependent hydrolase, partial [Thermococci archaeon]
MIITDNHMHLDPKGLGIEAAKKFLRAGGTHLFIVYKYAKDY